MEDKISIEIAGILEKTQRKHAEILRLQELTEEDDHLTALVELWAVKLKNSKHTNEDVLAKLTNFTNKIYCEVGSYILTFFPDSETDLVLYYKDLNGVIIELCATKEQLSPLNALVTLPSLDYMTIGRSTIEPSLIAVLESIGHTRPKTSEIYSVREALLFKAFFQRLENYLKNYYTMFLETSAIQKFIIKALSLKTTSFTNTCSPAKAAHDFLLTAYSWTSREETFEAISRLWKEEERLRTSEPSRPSSPAGPWRDGVDAGGGASAGAGDEPTHAPGE